MKIRGLMPEHENIFPEKARGQAYTRQVLRRLSSPGRQKLIDGAIYLRGPLGEGEMTAAF
jgi:hypothetical protein